MYVPAQRSVVDDQSHAELQIEHPQQSHRRPVLLNGLARNMHGRGRAAAVHDEVRRKHREEHQQPVLQISRPRHHLLQRLQERGQLLPRPLAKDLLLLQRKLELFDGASDLPEGRWKM